VVSDLIESFVKKELLTALKASMELTDWRSSQAVKPSDYEIVVLDTRIGARTEEDLREYEGLFMSMRPEIDTLLEAGGVVFVLAGQSISIKVSREMVETNYHFLPEQLLQRTALSLSQSRAGSRYDHNKEWAPYFLTEPKYYKVIGVDFDEEKGPHIERWVYGVGTIIEKVQPLAITKVTSEVVGCLISWAQGKVGVLPPPADVYPALLFLMDKGKELYKENIENLGARVEAPAWINDYRSSDHLKLEEEVKRLERELHDVRVKLRPFQIASTSLYSIGKGLENAVTRILSDFDWTVDDLTKKGEPIDYVIKRKKETSKSLVVALTGTTGYLDSKSGKLAQLLGALPEVGDNGRLVFLVNGSVETDPSSRKVTDYVTEEALKRMTKNDICVLLMYDLYRLWLDYLNKKTTTDEIFESIHGTCGIFTYAPR
jgi:hypothetical protein